MRRLIALVALGALLALAVLVLYGLGRAGLEAESRRLDADARASRGALLESARREVADVLAQVLVREAARPYYHWRPLFVPPDLVAKQIAFVPSPLAERPRDPLVRLYFEARDGALGSPAVPDVPTGEAPTEWTQEAAGLLATMRPLLPALQAQLGLPAGEPVSREVMDELVCRSNDRPDEALDQLGRTDAANQAALETEWNSYQSRVGKQSGRFSQRGQAPSAGVPVACFPLRLLRVGARADGWPQDLLAVRRVEVDQRAWLQGVLLDGRRLRDAVVPDLLRRLAPPALGPDATFDWGRGTVPTSGGAPPRLDVVRADAAPAGATCLPLEAPLEGLVVLDRAPATDPREHLARGRALLDGALGLALAVVVAGLALVALAARGERRLARRRADFVAAMTHELKAPLTGVRALAEMLHDDLVPDEQKKREYYAAMLGEAERLSRLVQNVLDASRLERGTLLVRPEALDPGPLLRDLETRVCPRLESEGFAVEVAVAPDLPLVVGDREAIAHVLGNLLDNAAKYGRAPDGKPTRIRLSASAAPGAGSPPGQARLVRVTVEDGGPGVPADERERVFGRFYRGRGAPSQVGGAGLGLTIARALAMAMRGDLTLDASPLGGARFTLTLPGASSAPLPSASQCMPG